LLRQEMELRQPEVGSLREGASARPESEWHGRALAAQEKLEKLRTGMRRLLDESAGLVNSIESPDAIAATGQVAEELVRGWKSPRQNKPARPATSAPEPEHASPPASSPPSKPPGQKAK
jgi:hypothetical protein